MIQSFKERVSTILDKEPKFDVINPDLGSLITYPSEFNDNKKQICKNFVNYIVKKLGLKTVPKISFVNERVNGMTTGAYSPSENKIYILALNRMLADVLRTLAHELVHAKQREDQKFDPKVKTQDAGGPIEDEANAKAGEYLKTFVRDLKMDVIYSL